MKKQIRQRSSRISPKSENKSSKVIKSPVLKPTRPDSDRVYFKSKKAKLLKEIEEETEKEKFMKKYGEVLEI